MIAVLDRRRAAEERHGAPQLGEKLRRRAQRLGDLEVERRKDAGPQEEHLLPAFEAGEHLLREVAVHHLARAGRCGAQVGRVRARAQRDRQRDRPSAGELAQRLDLARLRTGLRVVGGRQRFLDGEAQIVLADRVVHAAVADPRSGRESRIRAGRDDPPDALAAALDQIDEQRDDIGIDRRIVEVVDHDRADRALEVLREPARELADRIGRAHDQLLHRRKGGDRARRDRLERSAQPVYERHQRAVLARDVVPYRFEPRRLDEIAQRDALAEPGGRDDEGDREAGGTGQTVVDARAKQTSDRYHGTLVPVRLRNPGFRG